MALVFEPPAGVGDQQSGQNEEFGYTVPGPDYPLTELAHGLYGRDCYLRFPMLEGVPILSMASAVLASKLDIATR